MSAFDVIADFGRGMFNKQPAPVTNPGTAAQAVNNSPPAATQPTTPVQPLDSFQKLFTPEATDGKPTNWSTSFNPDRKAVVDASSTVNFMAGIPEDLLAKASKGDSTALADVVNKAAQAGLAQNTLNTAELINQALQRQADNFKNNVLPEVLKNNGVATATNAQLAVLSNPALAPVAEMIKQQLMIKQPTASATQIAEQVTSYMSGMAETVAQGLGKTLVDAKSETAKLNAETDWDAYFS